ncbi:MAG: hypothetical protein MUO18_07150 [Methanomassiliicoccales archaeon]|nr:hypothetical protein [Methanomassiliicoccales archaeon]
MKLRWRNVRYDETGKPICIIADGLQEGFKTSSPVAARLAPDVAEALAAWKGITPKPLPEWSILPRRYAAGRASCVERQGHQVILRHWQRLQKRWRLPPLRPVDVRHWVAGACRRADLSKQASAYLMGHDPTQGGAMRDWYDNPQIEDILAEQAEKLPYGPLGRLGNEVIELIEGLPPDAADLMREYLGGKINTMVFANRVEDIRLRGLIGQVSRPER